MRRNVLQRKSAPGETRTPNLLIRSQFPTAWLAPAIAFLQQNARPEADVETPKADRGSHNFSHNGGTSYTYKRLRSTLAGLFAGRPAEKLTTEQLQQILYLHKLELDRELTLINICLRSGTTRLLG